MDYSWVNDHGSRAGQPLHQYNHPPPATTYGTHDYDQGGLDALCHYMAPENNENPAPQNNETPAHQDV
jgi:hypothetical protein